jgi:hypothetical protein
MPGGLVSDRRFTLAVLLRRTGSSGSNVVNCQKSDKRFSTRYSVEDQKLVKFLMDKDFTLVNYQE